MFTSLLSGLAAISAFSTGAYALVGAPSLYPRATTAGAGVVPTGPGPNDKFAAGGPCQITWSPDTSGASTWKNMKIELMTGDNFDMITLKTVGKFDGTNTSMTSYTWTCPQVNPYSAIYFYQFTHDAEQDPSWTTRFTITSPSGDSVAPPQSTQPNGDAIPWGAGKLVGSSSSGSGSGSGSGTSSANVAPASSISGSTASTTSMAASSTTTTATSSSTQISSAPSAASSNAAAGAFSESSLGLGSAFAVLACIAGSFLAL